MNNSKRAGIFRLQCHITARCSNHCAVCYLKNGSSYYQELNHEMPLESWKNIFSQLINFGHKYSMDVLVSLTGGDPFLYTDFVNLIKYLRRVKLPFEIMGNPEGLTLKMAGFLKMSGVKSYQLSLDGASPEIHDRLRGKMGHFEKTLKAIEVLKAIGIPCVIKATISKANANEIEKIIGLVSQLEISSFGFARMTPYRKSDQQYLFDPDEYRDFLERVHQAYRNMVQKGTKTNFIYKDSLFKLLFFEKGEIEIVNDGLVHDGCSIGFLGLSVLADGTVYSCRHLPISIGKIPDQSIEDVFFDAPFQEKARNLENYEKCHTCPLLNVCRGNPCMSHALTGNPFYPDPQCWR